VRKPEVELSVDDSIFDARSLYVRSIKNETIKKPILPHF